MASAALALGLCLSLPGPALADDDARFRALVQEAVKAREAGDLQRTATMLQQAIELRPVPEMLNNLGRTYEALGRYREAVLSYRKVVGDPKADGVLKRLDATRIELLEPRLKHAWLAIDSVASDTRVYVDGDPMTWKPGKEVGIEAGPRTVQLSTPDHKLVQLAFHNFEQGRRSTVKPALGASPRDHGRLVWTDSSGVVTALSVNGYPVSGPVGALEGVHVLPGRYVVEVHQAGREPVSQALQVLAGKTADLTEALLSAPEAVVLAPVEVEGSLTLAVSTLGAGGLMAGVGATLLVLAAADRATVNDSVDENGVMTIPMTQAQELEDSANTYSSAGGVLIGVGAAAAAAGLTWWLMDSPTEEPSAARFFVAPSLSGATVGVGF